MSRDASAGRRILLGTARSFAAEALLIPCGLLTAVYLTRRLGPADYGLFGLAAVIVSWLQWSVSSALARASLKRVGEAAADETVATLVLRAHGMSAAVVAGLLFLLAAPLGGLLDESALAGHLRWFAADVVLFSLAAAHRQILLGRQQFTAQAWVGASRWLGRLLLIIVMVEVVGSVRGAIYGSLGASVVELLVARRYVQPRWRGASAPWRLLWGYAVPLSLAAISMRLFDKLDLLFLKSLGATTATAGCYVAAQNLTLLPGLLAWSASGTLLPSLSRLLREGQPAEAAAVARQALRGVLLLLPVLAAAAGSAPAIVALLYGADYGPAATVLAILLLAAGGLVMISVTTALLVVKDRPGWTLALAAPLLPLVTVGHLLAIPRWGAAGAAGVTAGGALLAAAAGVICVRRLWSITPPLLTAGRSTLATALVLVAALAAPVTGLLVIGKLVLLLMFGALVLFLLGEWPGFRGLGCWRRWQRGLTLGAFLLLAALWLAARSAWFVEHVYVEHIGHTCSRVLTTVSGALPFSLADGVLIGGGALVILTLARGCVRLLRRPKRRVTVLQAGLRRMVVAGSVVLALFYVLWGVHYARAPLASRLGWVESDSKAPGWTLDRAEGEALARVLAAEVNALYRRLHGGDDAGRPTGKWLAAAEMDTDLDRGYQRAATLLGLGPRFATARGPAKSPLVSPLMSRLGLTGVYFPFTGEALYNGEVPAWQIPRVVGHEKAHQRGLTHEGECNFMGFLVCALADEPWVRYSGYLMAYLRLRAVLGPAQGGDQRLDLLPGVQRDIAAANDFWRQHQGVLTTVSRRVNDQYLKLNRVTEGVVAYDRVAELVVQFARRYRVAGEVRAR